MDVHIFSVLIPKLIIDCYDNCATISYFIEYRFCNCYWSFVIAKNISKRYYERNEFQFYLFFYRCIK